MSAKKEIKELKFEELTTEQKIGMTMTAVCNRPKDTDVDFIEKLIKEHSLGALWITPGADTDATLKRLKNAADYPLLIICDAESGMAPHLIGKHNSVGMTDSEELAYMFGKVTAITARKRGYNVVCDPVIDMTNGNATCNGTARSLGGDKYKVAKLASAIARGMHDGGVLTVAKHYPGNSPEVDRTVDSHMAETTSPDTVETLLEYNLYPYMELDRQGLLDGVMLRHGRYPNIDPDYPASLSKELIKIFRDQGFEGFAITDALSMMGVVAKFGLKGGVGLSVANATDLALPWTKDNEDALSWIKEYYENGTITPEKLDASVKRVLAAQHKVYAMQPKFDDVTEEDIATFNRINTDYIYAKIDDGLPTGLDRDGKYYFVVLKETHATVDESKPDVDTFRVPWYHPNKITERLKELFPNSIVDSIPDYPHSGQVWKLLENSYGYETVFVTFYMGGAYCGEERFTPPLISLVNAMQVTNRISTVLHFGNPFVLEDFSHVSRVIIGTGAELGVEAGLNVLAGKAPANGVLTYDVKLK